MENQNYLPRSFSFVPSHSHTFIELMNIREKWQKIGCLLREDGAKGLSLSDWKMVVSKTAIKMHFKISLYRIYSKCTGANLL